MLGVNGTGVPGRTSPVTGSLAASGGGPGEEGGGNNGDEEEDVRPERRRGMGIEKIFLDADRGGADGDGAAGEATGVGPPAVVGVIDEKVLA